MLAGMAAAAAATLVPSSPTPPSQDKAMVVMQHKPLPAATTPNTRPTHTNPYAATRQLMQAKTNMTGITLQ